MDQPNVAMQQREPWNMGKLVGQKSPLKLKEIWAIRIRLQPANCTRDLALFDLAIDSKLRACDLVKLRVRDVCHGDRVATRAIVMQQKTQRPVQFEITEQTLEAAHQFPLALPEGLFSVNSGWLADRRRLRSDCADAEALLHYVRQRTDTRDTRALISTPSAKTKQPFLKGSGLAWRHRLLCRNQSEEHTLYEPNHEAFY